MSTRRGTYTGYSIGCGVVWTVLIVVRLATGRSKPPQAVLYVMAGWVIGWTSATIARYVYPPPKKYQVTA